LCLSGGYEPPVSGEGGRAGGRGRERERSEEKRRNTKDNRCNIKREDCGRKNRRNLYNTDVPLPPKILPPSPTPSRLPTTLVIDDTSYMRKNWYHLPLSLEEKKEENLSLSLSPCKKERKATRKRSDGVEWTEWNCFFCFISTMLWG
jgi:hypothetical protein